VRRKQILMVGILVAVCLVAGATAASGPRDMPSQVRDLPRPMTSAVLGDADDCVW
jgi:hypothetical protein